MIDVSDNNGVIDWHEVALSGVKQAYVKFWEDGIGRDPYAILNLHHARAAGVKVGLYAFAHPGKVTGHQAAVYFLNDAKDHMVPGDLPPALDLEVFEGQSLVELAGWKGDWFGVVDPIIRCHATFYSFRYMLNFMYQYLDPSRPVWGATGGDQPSAAELERWSWVQYGTGKVPGILGSVDLDRALTPTAPAPTNPVIPVPV